MAKKTFNISKTLNKNKEPELARKIPLSKPPKDEEEIVEKVEELHTDEKTIEAVKPKPTPKKKKVEQPKKLRLVRMTIDTPEDMHLKLKIKAVESRISIREYILRLIEKDLYK